MAPNSARALSLYRSILREHRRRLPPVMRKLGDDYVRNEFRLHKKTTKEEFLNLFFRGWEDYLKKLVTSQGGRFGQDLDQEAKKHLSEEQKGKLDELKKHSLEKGDA